MDKRELLKGYGVVCINKEQAKVMVEFVGNTDRRSDYFCVLKYNSITKNFYFGCLDDTTFSHLGEKTYEEACAMCGIGELEPSFENPVEMYVWNSDLHQYKRKVVKVFNNGSCLVIRNGCDGHDSNHISPYSNYKPIEQEPPKPKMRYMTPLEVIQQHTDKCVYASINNIGSQSVTITYFESMYDTEKWKVCRDKTQPIEDWKWEELMTEDV